MCGLYWFPYQCSYQVCKLFHLYAVRAIAAGTATRSPFSIVNTVNSGLCYTDLAHSAVGSTKVIMEVMRAAVAWTAEEGSRTLVHAVTTGKESSSVFICLCSLKNQVMLTS